MRVELPSEAPSARLRRRVGDGTAWSDDVACAFGAVRASNVIAAFIKVVVVLSVEITAFPGTGKLLLRHGALDIVGVTDRELVAVYSAVVMTNTRVVERWREPLSEVRPGPRGLLFGVIYVGGRKLYVPRRQHRDLVNYLWS